MSTATTPVSVREAAETRRSIRAYTPEPIPRAELEDLLRQSSLAPSAWNLQPWRFVIVQTPALKDKLAGVAYGQKQVTAAPAVIVLWTDMADTLSHLNEIARPGTNPEQAETFAAGVLRAFANKSEDEREAWGFAQGHIALGYLLLAAQAKGYATSPMAGFDPEGVKILLGLPAHARVPALIAIGHGAEAGLPHHRHRVERIAKFA